MNDISQITNGGLLEEQKMIKKHNEEEERSKGGLINRLGLLDAAKP